jgi:hypothetical protein
MHKDFRYISAGYVWAKVGTPKAEAFVAMINNMLTKMVDTNNSRFEGVKEN